MPTDKTPRKNKLQGSDDTSAKDEAVYDDGMMLTDTTSRRGKTLAKDKSLHNGYTTFEHKLLPMDVIQLQGDQKSNLYNFLLQNGTHRSAIDIHR